MHKYKVSVLFVMTMLIAGLGSMFACPIIGYDMVIASGLSDVRECHDFATVFPSAEHCVSHYTGWAGSPEWHSSAIISNRNTIRMFMEVRFNWARTRITWHSPPVFELDEIVTGQVGPGGAIYYPPERFHREFGVSEWERFIESNGDLGVLGVPASGINYQRALVPPEKLIWSAQPVGEERPP